MQIQSEYNPIGKVTSPMVNGSSVIALKYDEGIIVAADTLLAYGSLLKYNDICRHEKVTDNVLLTATGEYSDFKEASQKLQQLATESAIYDDGVTHHVQEYANYLQSICYERRNKQNPFYNNFVLAGFEQGKPYLASVDLHGAKHEVDHVVTGFSKYFGLAEIANHWKPTANLKETQQVIRNVFSVLFLRDCRCLDRIQMALVTKNGVEILAPETVPGKFNLKSHISYDNRNLWRM